MTYLRVKKIGISGICNGEEASLQNQAGSLDHGESWRKVWISFWVKCEVCKGFNGRMACDLT